MNRYTEELGAVVLDSDGEWVRHEDHEKDKAEAEDAATDRAYLNMRPVVDELERKLNRAMGALVKIGERPFQYTTMYAEYAMSVLREIEQPAEEAP